MGSKKLSIPSIISLSFIFEANPIHILAREFSMLCFPGTFSFTENNFWLSLTTSKFPQAFSSYSIL